MSVTYSKAGFETKDCPRCGGSGSYSYNMMNGSRCFQCAGAKTVFTKRGAAARAYFYASMEMPVADIKVGNVIFALGASIYGAKKWRTVLSIKPNTLNPGILSFETKFVSLGMHMDSTTTAVTSMAVRDQKLAESLVYQGTLNESGKVKGPRTLAREAREAQAENAEIEKMAEYYMGVAA